MTWLRRLLVALVWMVAVVLVPDMASAVESPALPEASATSSPSPTPSASSSSPVSSPSDLTAPSSSSSEASSTSSGAATPSTAPSASSPTGSASALPTVVVLEDGWNRLLVTYLVLSLALSTASLVSALAR